MSKVKFYLFGVSPPCRAVYMTFKALGLSPELKYIDLPNKEHLGDAFLKINPMHKLPTIVDGDFVLWESHAIMRYLVLKYGGGDNSLYPRDLQKRAVIDRQLDHVIGVFYRAMMEGIVIPTMKKEEPTKEQSEKATEAFDWLDSEVKDKKFIAGNSLTIADFAVAVGLPVHLLSTESRAKYPNTMAWLKRMQELPYYNEVQKPLFDFVEKMKKEMAAKK